MVIPKLNNNAIDNALGVVSQQLPQAHVRDAATSVADIGNNDGVGGSGSGGASGGDNDNRDDHIVAANAVIAGTRSDSKEDDSEDDDSEDEGTSVSGPGSSNVSQARRRSEEPPMPESLKKRCKNKVLHLTRNWLNPYNSPTEAEAKDRIGIDDKERQSDDEEIRMYVEYMKWVRHMLNSAIRKEIKAKIVNLVRCHNCKVMKQTDADPNRKTAQPVTNWKDCKKYWLQCASGENGSNGSIALCADTYWEAFQAQFVENDMQLMKDIATKVTQSRCIKIEKIDSSNKKLTKRQQQTFVLPMVKRQRTYLMEELGTATKTVEAAEWTRLVSKRSKADIANDVHGFVRKNVATSKVSKNAPSWAVKTFDGSYTHPASAVSGAAAVVSLADDGLSSNIEKSNKERGGDSASTNSSTRSDDNESVIVTETTVTPEEEIDAFNKLIYDDKTKREDSGSAVSSLKSTQDCIQSREDNSQAAALAAKVARLEKVIKSGMLYSLHFWKTITERPYAAMCTTTL